MLVLFVRLDTLNLIFCADSFFKVVSYADLNGIWEVTSQLKILYNAGTGASTDLWAEGVLLCAPFPLIIAQGVLFYAIFPAQAIGHLTHLNASWTSSISLDTSKIFLLLPSCTPISWHEISCFLLHSFINLLGS